MELKYKRQTQSRRREKKKGKNGKILFYMELTINNELLQQQQKYDSVMS